MKDRNKNDKGTSAFVEWIKDVAELIKDNHKILIAVVAFIVLLVAAILISTRVAKRSRDAVVVIDEEDEDTGESYAIPDDPLKQDAYPEVNNLMKKYYAAAADGDIETIETLRLGLDDKEKIIIQKKAEYVDSYPSIICYTKPGPIENSYLAYVNYEVKLKDFDELIPGMNVWYVCADESGRYYVNEDPQDEKVVEYCKIVSVQDDVQDLSNTINVKYNEIMESNSELAKFMEELGVQMRVDVGEELAKAEAGIVTEESEPEEPAPEPEETVEVVKTVKANTVVNVRASDSEKADRVGRASEGQEFTLLEERANGWSKIDYEGQEAYIKSEYLDPASTETVAEADTDDTAADNDGTDNKTDDDTGNTTAGNNDNNTGNNTVNNSPSSGTATATDTIKVRAKASTDSDQIGLIYGGGKVEVVEKQSDGWTKINYNGKTGYVKSEYLR